MARKAQVLQGATLPPRLRDLPEPPERVFLHGILPRGPAVAVVGTRQPSQAATDYARQLGRELSLRGIAVLSGGAAGIDRAAHEGALEGSGVTVVVAPSGWDSPYPKEHAELFEQIVSAGGAHLSACESGVLARRHQFFLRNSMLVALSHAVVIVEAPLRSGARNAAKWAREMGRPCFVVPSSPWHAQGLGGLLELQRGAARVLVSVRDVTRCLGEMNLHAVGGSGARASSVEANAGGEAVAASGAGSDGGLGKPRAQAKPRKRRASKSRPSSSLSPLERAIASAVDAGARHPDEVASLAKLTAADVSHGSLLLVLKGLLIQESDGTFTPLRR